MRRGAAYAPGRVPVRPASPADVDAAAEAADPRHSFLRAAWAQAAHHHDLALWVAERGDGGVLAAFPFVRRRVGPFAIREVAGCYWPFRSVPVAVGAGDDELVRILRDRGFRRAAGRAWRMGPVFADDPAAARLRAAAELAGWVVLRRVLGTCFEIPVQALQADGPWPRGPTMKKNRWREKRLAEGGAVTFARFSAAEWTEGQRDAIAAIERNSWLSDLGGKAATQFADPNQRAFWEAAARDPVIAAMVFGTILLIGGEPAAFSFGMDVGGTRYQIANNYDRRFSAHSAGRTLLLKEFELAAAAGIGRISWGSGDAGYKTELGAQPGPEIVDLLFVRGQALAAALRPAWQR